MNVQGFRKMSESLRLYHRITNDKYSDVLEASTTDNLLEKLYVDILPNNGILDKILERNTTFLVGRRGTGKSTIIAMAQNSISKRKKDMCLYLNAKSVYKSCEVDNTIFPNDVDSVFTQNELFRIALIKKFIETLCESLVEELKKEKKNLLEKFKSTIRDKQIQQLIDEVQRAISSEEFKRIDKIVSKSETIENKDKLVGELKLSLSEKSVGAMETSENGINTVSQCTLARVFNVSEIISKFLEVLDICERKGMYVFIDDYSELSFKERSVVMNELLAPIYHLGVDRVFLKIACYPNRVAPINLDAQKYTIKSIDYFDIYGIDNSITDTEKQAAEYVKRLVNNACKVFCDCQFEEYFDTSNTTMETYYMTLHRVCMNVPRVLGHILNTCYMKRVTFDKQINLSTLYDASKQYYYDHIKQEMENKILCSDVDKEMKVNIFVQQKIISSIIEMAQRNRTLLPQTPNNYFKKYKEVPTSHFRIAKENEIYFEDLEFYGYLHKVNEIADKGRKLDLKNSNTSVYAIDYGICLDEKILYGKPDDCDTKYFQQRAFLYDDCVMKVLTENKKIECTSCKAVYPIEQLDAFKIFRMKCQKCDNGVCAVTFDDKLLDLAQESYKDAIWTTQEMDIIYALYRMEIESDEGKVSASKISGEIDLSSYIIAARCKELAKASYINRDESITPYKYWLSERSKEIIKSMAK